MWWSGDIDHQRPGAQLQCVGRHIASESRPDERRRERLNRNAWLWIRTGCFRRRQLRRNSTKELVVFHQVVFCDKFVLLFFQHTQCFVKVVHVDRN
jgi:hypothetical protein